MVVARVAEHLKALGDEFLGGLERAHRIGQQRLGVAQHFQLDPVGAGVFQAQQNLASQPGHADGVFSRKAAGRVGQQRVAAGVEIVEQVLPLGVDQPLAAHRHGDAVGARQNERLGHQLVVGVFSGADDQPAGERMRADLELVGQLQVRSQGLSSSDKGHHFQPIARPQLPRVVLGPGNQLEVHFDRHVPGVEFELGEERGNAAPRSRSAVGR